MFSTIFWQSTRPDSDLWAHLHDLQNRGRTTTVAQIAARDDRSAQTINRTGIAAAIIFVLLTGRAQGPAHRANHRVLSTQLFRSDGTQGVVEQQSHDPNRLTSLRTTSMN